MSRCSVAMALAFDSAELAARLAFRFIPRCVACMIGASLLIARAGRLFVVCESGVLGPEAEALSPVDGGNPASTA